MLGRLSLKSFGREAEAVAALRHPNLVENHVLKPDANSYNYLRGVVASCCPGNDVVFKATIKADRLAVPAGRGQVASATIEGRELFDAFVSELRERLLL